VIVGLWLLKPRRKETITATAGITDKNGHILEKTVTSNIITTESPKAETLKHLTSLYDDHINPTELEHAYEQLMPN
jgi:hypothetical protein